MTSRGFHGDSTLQKTKPPFPDITVPSRTEVLFFDIIDSTNFPRRFHVVQGDKIYPLIEKCHCWSSKIINRSKNLVILNVMYK